VPQIRSLLFMPFRFCRFGVDSNEIFSHLYSISTVVSMQSHSTYPPDCNECRTPQADTAATDQYEEDSTIRISSSEATGFRASS
jgi:hypothetical protein